MDGKYANRLIQMYSQLSPAVKAMVQIMAVHVVSFRQKDLIFCLDFLGIRDQADYKFIPKTIQPIVRDLARAGIIIKKPVGISCAPEMRIHAAKEAVLSGTFSNISEAVQRVKSFDFGMDEIRSGRIHGFYRAFQMATFLKNPPVGLKKVIETGRRYCGLQRHTPFFDFFGSSFDSRLMEYIPGKTRAVVLSAAVAESDMELEPCPGLHDYSCSFFTDNPGMLKNNPGILESLLLRGDIARHRELVARLPKSAAMEKHSHLGWAYFIRGKHEEAFEEFQDALGLAMKKAKGTPATLPGLPGLFLLFSLLKNGAPFYLQQGFDCAYAAMEKDIDNFYVLQPMAALFEQKLGDQGGFADIMMQFSYISEELGGLKSFFKTHILFLFDPKLAKPQVDSLKGLKTKAAASGHTWIEAEVCALLAALECKKKSNQKAADDNHAKCGTVSLVTLFKKSPKWERTLNALAQIAQTGSPEKETKANVDDQRLIWLFSHDEHSHTATVAPRLQKKNKKGGWTKGRAVALKGLYKNYRTMDWLTDHDRKICSTIEENYYRSGYYRYNYTNVKYEFDWGAALNAAVGHPLIFLEDNLDVPVELAEGAPEIRFRTVGAKFVMTMEPVPSYISQSIAVVRETPSRFKLVRYSVQHERMAEILGEKGVNLPKKAKESAVKTLTALTSLVQINSDLAVETEGASEFIEAHALPYAHIMPWQGGVIIEFWTRPFKNSGSYFKPGKGGAHVFAEKQGKKLNTRRDLTLEEKNVREVIHHCPSIGRLEPVADQWRAEDPELALEILEELHACRDRVELEWPKGETFKLRPQVSFDQLEMKIKKDRDWFKATGRLEIDEALSLDLKKLIGLLDQASGRFIPLDDNTYLSLTQSLKDRLEEFKAYSTAHGSGFRFPPLAGPAVNDLIEQAGSAQTDRAWKTHLSTLTTVISPDVPSTLTADLRPYQCTGFKWLAQLAHWQVGACLADDMGLGKTLQALSAILFQADKGPTLVVAPLSVMPNWEDECRRFAPTLVPKFFGPGNRQEFLDALRPYDLVISSYGLLQTEGKKLAGVDWQTVVLDEAQAIKNMKSKRSRAAMALKANFRLITTGTPVENHLEELWTLFNFINPGLLGRFARFKETFATPIEQHHDQDVAGRLRKLIRPFILRRLKIDVLKELPEKTEITLNVELSEEEIVLYEAQRLVALENIESAKEDAPGTAHLKILAELTRLRQLCCHPRLLLPESRVSGSKLRVFGDTVDELLKNRHKILVFSQFVGHLRIIREYLDAKGISYQYLDGSTPAAKRRDRIARFQAGEGDLFLISLKAGGSGLNLTAADYVIHMDPWWNPAVEDQASDRAHRIGQERPVTVYRLVVKNSIEEKIMELHREKRELAEGLLADSDTAGKISAGELLNLLSDASFGVSN